jgi:Niemann-Pick C1 protein
MALMQVELASLNGSVISPVFSWVPPFQQFVKGGDWSEACGSDQAKILDFNDQVKQFVQIKVTSKCCQSYGICGEQFVTDIKFDDDGKVSATRFRFSHTPVRYQKNFIDDLVLTRRVADQFSEQLIPLKTKKASIQYEKVPTMKDRLMNLFGI